MARTEARVFTEIWGVPEWRALSSRAQYVYLFLISQPDLAYTGVISLRLRRWSAAAQDLVPSDFTDGIKELTAASLVLVDDDTEELLIRSFIRRDRIYTQPNLLWSAQNHLGQIESHYLRRALWVEIDRILSTMDDYGVNSRKYLEKMRSILDSTGDSPRELSSANAIENPEAENPSEKPSVNPSLKPSGDRGTYGLEVSLPLPPNPDPLLTRDGELFDLEPSPSASRRADARRAKAAKETPPSQNVQSVIGSWLERLPERPPGRVVGHVSRLVKEMIDGDRLPPGKVQAGLAEWQRRGLHPSSLPSVIHELSNGGPRRGRPSAEQRTERHLSVVEQLRQEADPAGPERRAIGGSHGGA
jgi:hypothetical protein